MNTKILTSRALSVIEQYSNFNIGSGTCSVPYFNNKTAMKRLALRVNAGKGSPQEIHDEVLALMVKSHISTESLTREALKKILTDQNLGIDCSGFAYYILNAESLELGKGALDKRISFINCHGLLGKMRCSLRPVENCDVATLAHDKNSSVIAVKDVLPGDMIVMLDNRDEGERDHILIISQVEYQDLSPIRIHYSHAVAYPEDGVYGTGIKHGTIEIADPDKPITEAIWTENGTYGDANRIFLRAQKSKTDVRRIN